MDYKTELSKAKSDLHQAEHLQEMMKKANAILRGKGDEQTKVQLLVSAGWKEENAKKILSPDFMGRKGFPQYKLTNNNALIKRLEEKVKKLETNLKGSKSETEERYVFEGGEVFVNYEINRVQILFPGGRTDKETFQKLRRSGFVYSPSNKAFQRQITPIAIRTAVSLFDAKKVEEGELEKGIKVESEHADTINKIASGEISPEKAPEEIAKDHLTEDQNYYDKLEVVEGSQNELEMYKNILNNIEKYPKYNKKNVEQIISELESNLKNTAPTPKRTLDRVENLSSLDTHWTKFKNYYGDDRYYRKFVFSPEEARSPMFRDFTDRGVKEIMEENPKNGYISVTLSVSNTYQTKELDDLYEEIYQKYGNPGIKTTEEVFEPNTNEEYFEAVINNIKDKIPADWVGDQAREVAVKNAIWHEVTKIDTGASEGEKREATEQVFEKMLNEGRNKEYKFDYENGKKYEFILNIDKEKFKEKFGIAQFNTDQYLRTDIKFKNGDKIWIDLTLGPKKLELYGSSLNKGNTWSRWQDIEYWLHNALNHYDNIDLIKANLNTSNKEWTSHPKSKSMSDYQKERERQIASGEISPETEGISLYALSKEVNKPKVDEKPKEPIEKVALGFSPSSGTSEGGTYYLYSLEPNNYTFYLNEPVEIDGLGRSDGYRGVLKDTKYNGEYKSDIIFPVGTRVQVAQNKDEWNSKVYMYNPNVIDEWVGVRPYQSDLMKIKKSIEMEPKVEQPQVVKLKAEEFVAPVSNSNELMNKVYDNQYELNKAIENFVKMLGPYSDNYTSDQKAFIKKYSGYGGLSKYGPGGKGAFFEYYTPVAVIRKMWALAYKYGYKGGSILEPSVGTGEFLAFAPPNAKITGFEISEHSATICKVLYPEANIIIEPFEKQFIAKNNVTLKDKVEPKYDLVIGNPPYGSFDVVKSRYMNMGEDKFTEAKNYAEYFMRRSMDLLKPNGLLVFIIGASIEGGGTLFLDSGLTPVKEYLAQHCDLLDAYRLPDAVFERTGVTSEIVVLQKKG